MLNPKIEAVLIQQALLIILCEDGPIEKSGANTLTNLVQSDDVFRFMHYLSTQDALIKVANELGGLIQEGYVVENPDCFAVSETGKDYKVMVDEEALFYGQTTERLESDVAEVIKQEWLSVDDAIEFAQTFINYAKEQQEKERG